MEAPTRRTRQRSTRFCGADNRPPGLWQCLATAGLAALFLALVPELVLANGGTLRVANVEMGGYRVSVFTDPTPVRPDTLDLSVLVTRAEDGRLAEGVRVHVRVAPVEGPGAAREWEATREWADDPRYHAAKFSLGEPGPWEFLVAVEGPEGQGETSFQLRAREWGLLANPVILLLLSLLPLAGFAWWLLRDGGENPV